MDVGSDQKLLIIIAPDQDADLLIQGLVGHGYPATKMSSTGGFLRRGNATIISGVDTVDVADVMMIVRKHCRARTEPMPSQGPPPVVGSMPLPEVQEVRVGGAVVFIIPCERIEKM